MQLLFHKPWNLLKGHDFMELTTEVDLPTHMLGIERKLIKLLCEQHLTYKEGSHLGGLQIVEAELSDDIVEEMFRFLVMTTWRDVSLIMEINLAADTNAHLLH